MAVINQDPAEFNLAGARVRLLMSGKQTAGVFCMMEVIGPPGRSTPMHVHDREEETIHVLEGVVDATIDGRLVRLQAGDTALLPRHIPHRLGNSGTSDYRFVLVCTPAGFDEFVQSCADPVEGAVALAPPSEEAIKRMQEEAPRFGITLLPG